MKEILTILALLLSLSASSQAKIGFTAGINKTDGLQKNADFLNIDSRTSFNVGAGIDVRIIDLISVEPLILFSNKGWVFTDSEGFENENSLQYLSAQLLGKLHVLDNVKILAGPEFGYLLKAKTDGENSPLVQIFNEGEAGAIFGVEVTLFDRISLHGKYTFGLNDVLNLDFSDETGNQIGTTDIKNRVIMVGATVYPFKMGVN